MKIELTGRVAVVTGGSRGIGLAISHSLAGAGATVAVVGRTLATAEAAALAIGGAARGFACDVAETASVQAMMDAVERTLGPVAILVNNAGITRDNIIPRLKDADWDDVLNANLRGAFLTTRAASRGMMKARWGRIINVSSIVGLTGNKGQTNYAASKAGLIGFTKSVARELASRHVLANVVAPGYIETDMTHGLGEEVRAALLRQIPLDRLGTPADVAAVVTFLASEQASYITGQVFVVDGGMAM
jgi:3-oxoacyl-[acyl-carrier protein] reductase